MTVGARPVVLVGLMGAGKSTVGRALARALGVPFVDNDDLLGAREGRTAREIAARDGAEDLHDAESAVAFAALRDSTPRVVALAASVADDKDVVEELRRHDVVWLRAPASTLRERVNGRVTHRPRATDLGESLEQQEQRRAGTFGSVARTVVDVDGRTPAQIVATVLDALAPPAADQRA